MASTRDEGSPLTRRVPQQARSRDRVQRILEVTADLVVGGGVDALSTRSIASAAGVPVASLYQYFADKEEVLLALMEDFLREMDEQVDEDLAELGRVTVQNMVPATMLAFEKVYNRHPAFVVIWMRGRTNPAVADFCRRRNQQLAKQLFSVARGAGIVDPASTGLYAELAVEVADRIFQIAFEDSFTGDRHVIDEGIAMVTAYLQTHAVQP